MCDLLALCFNVPVNPKFSFENFRFKDNANPDGWGIAFYQDKSAQVIKEATRASDSKLAEMLSHYDSLKSEIIISHVRAGSNVSHKNCHPFSRELNGQDWTFAHNGTLNKTKIPSANSFKPVGDIDSEKAFCYLLQLIKDKNISTWSAEEFIWLEKELQKINDMEVKGFNAIFSNGEYLFCYSDKNQYNHLSFIKRKAPFGEITLLDKKSKTGEGFINLDAEKDPNQTGFIISTTDRTGKPTSENWENFKGGELKVFRDGVAEEFRMSSSVELSKDQIRYLRFMKRECPHKVTITVMAEGLRITQEKATELTKSLFQKGWIRRSPRLLTFDESALYMTMEEKGNEIDRILDKK